MSENDRFIGKEIKKLSNCMKRAAAKNCREDDVTDANSWLIMYLYEHRKEDVFQKDIEYEFSIRRSTSSNIISLMEKKGYIERASVSHDARLKKIILTDKSLEICNHIQKNMIEFEKILKNGISDEELKNFYSVIDRIVDNINNI